MNVKKILCRLFGHKPRGPLDFDPYDTPFVLYSCYRCNEMIYFDRDKGWMYYD